MLEYGYPSRQCQALNLLFLQNISKDKILEHFITIGCKNRWNSWRFESSRELYQRCRRRLNDHHCCRRRLNGHHCCRRRLNDHHRMATTPPNDQGEHDHRMGTTTQRPSNGHHRTTTLEWAPSNDHCRPPCLRSNDHHRWAPPPIMLKGKIRLRLL